MTDFDRPVRRERDRKPRLEAVVPAPDQDALRRQLDRVTFGLAPAGW